VANSRHSAHPPFLAQTYWVVLATILTASAVVAAATQEHAGPKTQVVTIADMRFNPETLTVHQGDRITWVNNDFFPHSATATTGAFDSLSIMPNASWTYVAKKAGHYPYACSFHPTMKAMLTVQ
jgi:plastocyanin